MSTTLSFMLASAKAAEEALSQALAEVRQAVAYAELGKRNAAAGSLMCVKPQIETANTLVGAALLLHVQDRTGGLAMCGSVSLAEFDPLPTADRQWGLWGAAVRGGFDPVVVWDACSRVLAVEFGLERVEVRALLDAPFGRHLGEALLDMPVPPPEAQVDDVVLFLRGLLPDPRHRRWMRDAAAAAIQARDAG